jgi:hypothetical protein
MLPFLALLASCSSDADLRPFSSDGCSLFPDSSLIDAGDWCACCFDHDIAYWRGGTSAEREAADLTLRECVMEKSGSERLATAMYQGVRLGGSPYFYNWYRWGYGWSFDRKYEPVTDAENLRADALLEQYRSADIGAVCR